VEKIWLKSYPKGVPAEIDVNTYASVRDVFDRVVGESARGRRTPAWASPSRLPSSKSARRVRRIPAGAWARKGARVALMMPNILQYPVCLFGILRAATRS